MLSAAFAASCCAYRDCVAQAWLEPLSEVGAHLLDDDSPNTEVSPAVLGQPTRQPATASTSSQATGHATIASHVCRPSSSSEPCLSDSLQSDQRWLGHNAVSTVSSVDTMGLAGLGALIRSGSDEASGSDGSSGARSYASSLASNLPGTGSALSGTDLCVSWHAGVARAWRDPVIGSPAWYIHAHFELGTALLAAAWTQKFAG